LSFSAVLDASQGTSSPKSQASRRLVAGTGWLAGWRAVLTELMNIATQYRCNTAGAQLQGDGQERFRVKWNHSAGAD